MMGAYRIGRIDYPWVNFTPPIRGGIFRKYQDEEEIISSEDENHSLGSRSASFSSNSSATSLELAPSKDELARLIPSISNTSPSRGSDQDKEKEVNRRRAVKGRSTSDPHSGLRYLKGKPLPSHQTPDAYTAETIQSEVDYDLANYPALDPDTQRNITLKYQELHQLVKDGGFYQCRYSEYGKEFIRYSLLFSIFLVTLHYGWYMTSAAFLGLFWVSAKARDPYAYS
jgi:delta8-fatty-acid desaturase